MPFVRSVKRSMSRPGSSGKWFARTSVVSCVVAVAGGTPVGQPAAPKNCPDTARVITASLPRVLNTVAAKGESTKKTMCFMVQNKFSTSEEKHLCTLPASTRTGHQMAPWIRDSADSTWEKISDDALKATTVAAYFPSRLKFSESPDTAYFGGESQPFSSISNSTRSRDNENGGDEADRGFTSNGSTSGGSERLRIPAAVTVS
eukprot:CAMPEP_0174369046 /NCGR_PEP_ID=MMETSP0811_2-20130205/91149_1 /TAXON_ID=73025 ORGANISM="Eutreptiella gymnastica-like, Strain CCMP1594" /NCGR_SAMPLE_ID=MMETSP0811_2 /ASSEMBLY_ACC=CAM_ASM_000667 /LENGTH=202 /DNA_ID=CAMNT_0015513105 /DNA_START=138 /DNA_END=747 /DNA_ORIENTATION=-